MQCVLCAFHDDNGQHEAIFVINGTSVCEDHGTWIMSQERGDSQVFSHNFNIQIDDLEDWLGH